MLKQIGKKITILSFFLYLSGHMGTHILQDMRSLTISVYISTALVKQFTASEKYDKIIQNCSVYSKKGDGVIPQFLKKSPVFI